MPPPIAHAEMLIRIPVHRVFGAFVDPQQICRFWLKNASGPLEQGAEVEWEFMVPGARESVTVTDFQLDERIVFEWSDGKTVDMRFHAHSTGGTRVAVTVTGFTGESAAAEAVDASEGFAIVLCDLKIFLETGRCGGIVRDKALLIQESMAASGDRPLISQDRDRPTNRLS